MASEELRTQREILASLHLPRSERNCCNNLLDDENPRGFGARHLALVVVTFTFSVMCLSVLRSGNSTRSVSGRSSTGSGIVPDRNLALHYVDGGISELLVFHASVIKSNQPALKDIIALAKHRNANAIAFVGAHDKADTARISDLIANRHLGIRHIYFILSVADAEEHQVMTNIFADSAYFSVISRATNVEILSAKSERVALTSSAISVRLESTPIKNLILLTDSEVDDSKGLTARVTLINAAKEKSIALRESEKSLMCEFGASLTLLPQGGLSSACLPHNATG